MYYALAAEEYAKGKKYIGTPGFYTVQGHHHCTQGQPGCVSTDPRKSIKLGYKLGPGECRPDLDRYGKGHKDDCKGQGGGGIADTHKSNVSPLIIAAVIAIPAIIIVKELL
jgi:hypothetical protein